MVDFSRIAKKWQERWEKEKVFQAGPDKRKKYYIAIVYPYMSGLLHLGHLFTYTSPEIMLRYKRMNNINVLVKFGFHCTGTPIVAAAQRVKENEPKQIETLKKMGISESEISKFENPEYWIDYFPKETLKDIKSMGFSIDERYTFTTTSLNPPYDAMIKWQFNKLKEKGYVKKGKHPVVWCPKDNAPTGDHARAEGEGETVKDFMWVKFKLKGSNRIKLKDSDLIIVAGTTRPDALFGQTNLWVHPDATYAIVQVGDEKWVVGKEVVSKIKDQFTEVEVVGEIRASELMGKWVKGPLVDREIYILPAEFIDPKIGSGIVYSALETPQDLMEVKRLNDEPEMIKKFNLDSEVVKKIIPIPNIKIDGMGENLGQEICDEYGAKSYKDEKELEDAKQEINKRVFRKGVMRKNSGKYKGMTVKEAQPAIKNDLISSKDAVMFYELSGRVVCRCLTECIVKMVSDQWFIEYNDPKWKKMAHKCLDKMKIYPEQVRKQFDYVLDWLNHWACTREFGLGTRLPWDKKWVIESLSDSTIQMAYGTISKYLQNPDKYGFKVDKLNDEFFDYVFMGKGKADSVESSTGIPAKMIDTMKNDFNYWYPFDFRNSAKDLVQNHLSFCIFNHTALFPEKHWPKAFIINGRIMVNNEKMSKSKGNFFTMRELYEKHGPDIVRLTAANAGEGVDDANYGMDFLETAKKKLFEMYSFIRDKYNKGRDTSLHIDNWFESKINEAAKKTTDAIENMLFKSAVQFSFLDMQRSLKWYMKRTNDKPSKRLINLFIETHLKLLAPFIPHFCEECWEMIGKKGLISIAEWPKADVKAIKAELDDAEELVKNTMSDIRTVMKLSKIEKPKSVELLVSKEWKYGLFKKVNELLEKTQNPGDILKAIMAEAKFKKFGMEIAKFLPKMVSSRRVPMVNLSHKDEVTALKESADFIKSEFGCDVNITEADKSKEAKANSAVPGKPAILLK